MIEVGFYSDYENSLFNNKISCKMYQSQIDL